jgi:hypothetical protein
MQTSRKVLLLALGLSAILLLASLPAADAASPGGRKLSQWSDWGNTWSGWGWGNGWGNGWGWRNSDPGQWCGVQGTVGQQTSGTQALQASSVTFALVQNQAADAWRQQGWTAQWQQVGSMRQGMRACSR